MRLTLVILLITAAVVFAIDDDLEFEELTSSTPAPSSTTSVPVRRQWGIPDYQAIVGKLFVAKIPKDAFSGDVDYFEPGAVKSRTWPRWLDMNKAGVMKGVPSSEDVGVLYLMVRAVGPHAHHYSKDIFAIDVIKPGLDSVIPESLNKGQCAPGVDPMMLTILMDLEFKSISPQRRVGIIETIAGYLGLSQEIFYLRELTTPRDILSLADSTVVMAGPGNVKSAKDKDFASLSFQVGCGRDVGKAFESVIERVRSDARDGTLAEVLQSPVVGWHARNELPAFFRDRREAGSGDSYPEDEDDDYSEGITTIATPHPHRHHHGEENDMNRLDGMEKNYGTFAGPEVESIEPSEIFYHRPSTQLLMNYDNNIISTPAFIPERPTISATSSETIQPTRVTEIDLTPSSVTTGVQKTTFETDYETNRPVTVPVLSSSSDGNFTDLTSESSVDVSQTGHNAVSSSGSSSSSSSSATTPELISTDFNSIVTNHTWTTIGTTTEDFEQQPKNFRPQLAHRLKKVAVIAGKVLKFKIPGNTFVDIEDGDTSHLAVSLKTMEGNPLPLNYWIMLNESSVEIIALPLEEHVSKWEFLVEARDKDDDYVSDTFELQVQQHKGTRTVNHEFSLSLSLARNAFVHSLDWQLQVISALVKVNGDHDASHITVRSITTLSDTITFTWTNDSLPRRHCPKQDIDRLMKVISASDDGTPSFILQEALRPSITVQSVSYQGIENCETKVLTIPPPPPEVPTANFAPVPRNQIDQLNATAGQLFIFSVPVDTFYDPEDGGTRKLQMSLLNMDTSPLSPTHWLQFDSKNQEFYGLPWDKDVRSQEYQLVCKDRDGLTANDGLLVVVRPRIHRRYSVEFSIALDVAYDAFINSAALKRKFVERLQQLFEDADPSSIVIHTISSGSTVITWFNSSLPTDHCPEEEIHRLRRILINDNEIMSDRLVSVMGSELPVISVGLEPAGACQGELTVLHKPETPLPPSDESFPLGVNNDYLITYIMPTALIAVMLIVAGLFACFFYRKRRASKMGIGDEEERQSFRSKGIPVIFQDELEDKPEPENKNPVIMKEEKPPLPPPEYQRGQEMNGSNGGVGEDAPYHPPPPFPSSRDSGRHSRPKPTPTYRKPPPYVPP